MYLMYGKSALKLIIFNLFIAVLNLMMCQMLCVCECLISISIYLCIWIVIYFCKNNYNLKIIICTIYLDDVNWLK